MDSLPADNLDRQRDARTVYEAVQPAEGASRRVDAPLFGDVHTDKESPFFGIGHELFPGLLVDVGHQDAPSPLQQRFGGRSAETGAPTGDHEDPSVYLHTSPPTPAARVV